MKVLVATKEGQGERKNDFFWTDEGEVVHFGFECTSETVDGGCGCARSMVGLNSKKATTTMKVTKVGSTKKDLITRLKVHYMLDFKMEADRAERIATEELEDLREIVKGIPIGTVLEKRGEAFFRRLV